MHRRLFVFWIAPLLLPALGASAGPCLPPSSPAPTSCSTVFKLDSTQVNDFSLISSAVEGRFSTSLKYRVVSTATKEINFSWKKSDGVVLLAGSNRPFFEFFPIPVDFFDWGQTDLHMTPMSTPIGFEIKIGTGEFSIKDRGGLNFPCDSTCFVGYHEFLPAFPLPISPLLSGGAGGGETQRAMGRPAAAATDPEISINEIQGALTVYKFDPSAPDDLDQAIATLVLDYTSAVEWTGSEYHYRYSITNHSDAEFGVSWALAELSGVLDAQASLSRSFASALKPGIARSVTTTTFGSDAISGGVGLLQPVPLPASLPLLAAAIGYLARRASIGRART